MKDIQFKYKAPREYAQKLITTLGAPTCVSEQHPAILMWLKPPSPYIEIKLIDEYIPHSFPKPHHDFVYSKISLKKYGKITPKIACALLKVTGSIIIDLLKQEVTARCGGRLANDVTLSFVCDVLQKKAQPTKKEYAHRILNGIVTRRQFNLHKKIQK